MYRIRTACSVCAVLIAFACSKDSYAGGFDRFEQGIDLLFDPGRMVFDITSTFYLPNRKFDTVNGTPETVPLDQNAFWLSLNVKFVPFQDAACLAAYREPFG